MYLCKHFYNIVLHGVCILKFVHEGIFEPVRKIFAHLRIGAQQAADIQEKVVEVERIILFQMLFVLHVDAHIVFDMVFVSVLACVLVGLQAEHLCVAYVELCVFEHLIVVKVELFKAFFNYVFALCFAVNGKVGLYARLVGIAAEYAHTHGVYGAYPHIRYIAADKAHPLLHFGGGLVGKCYGEYLPG